MTKLTHALNTLLMPLRIVAAFGGGITTLTASYAVLFSIMRGQRKERTIILSFRGMRIPIVLGSSTDFALIREIFLEREYEHPPIENAKVIFDVGANVGVASLYFHALYPDATIHAFEADPVLFNVLRERMKDIPQIVPHHLALSDTDGTRTFYSTPSSLAGSLMRRSAADKAVEVPTRTIASIADELGITTIDLLKFDIEGGELLLLKDAANRSRANYLIGEVHLDLLGMDKETYLNTLPEFTTSFEPTAIRERSIIRGANVG